MLYRKEDYIKLSNRVIILDAIFACFIADILIIKFLLLNNEIYRALCKIKKFIIYQVEISNNFI